MNRPQIDADRADERGWFFQEFPSVRGLTELSGRIKRPGFTRMAVTITDDLPALAPQSPEVPRSIPVSVRILIP